jgi:hypothetical protein
VNKRSWKFGGGVSTPSLPTRVMLTACMLALGAMLVVKILREASYSQLPVTAFVFFLLGVWLLAAVVFVPYLWRPSREWRREKYESHRLERRLAAALGPNRLTDPVLARARAAYCPVCGQQGPPLVVSRTRCSACQRPWAARAGAPGAVIDLRATSATRPSR